jgi:hypothetical protein
VVSRKANEKKRKKPSHFQALISKKLLKDPQATETLLQTQTFLSFSQ